jgi:hypothetical protein
MERSCVSLSLKSTIKEVSFMSKKKDLLQRRTDKQKKDIALTYDKNECFVLRNSIVYLTYLLDYNTVTDRNIFEVLSWILGNKFKKLEKKLFDIMRPLQNRTF